MSPWIYIASIVCVTGIAIGQILFKLSAAAMNAAGTMFALKPLLLFGITGLLYAITSVGWVLILRFAELGKVYPVMALAFVMVPLASHFIFGERFSTGYFVGSTLLLAGLVIIVATQVAQ